MWSPIYTAILKNKFILIACLIILGYLMPYYILGADTHIRVHDNLDSNIVWYKMIAESGNIFSMPYTEFDNVINGLPRSSLPSGLDAMVWLYVLFGPFPAYVINQTVMRFVAFFGMYLLLKKTVLPHIRSTWIWVGVALGFSLLPYWPSGELSIAGLPLALHIFLTIRSRAEHTPKIYWMIIFLFPFFSSFILTFVFFLSLIGLLWLVDLIRSKDFNLPFFLAIFVMSSLYLIKNYLVIYSMFVSSSFTSHRDELDLGHKDLQGTLELFLENFYHGHTHDMDLHFQLIYPVVGLALLVAAVCKLKPKWLVWCLVANALLSLIYAFWYWEGMRLLKDNFMVANTFNFSRIHFLHPMFWYICFALALAVLWKHVRFGRVLVALLIVGQCVLLFPLNEEHKYAEIGTPTFNEFYSTALFQEIEDYIGKDLSDYRIVSVAMHPTIAQYNGFYTLDTYNTSYPLAYKKKFRKVIAPELEESPTLENYYDTWGSRAYMFVSDIGKHYLFTKNSKRVIEDLDINTKALKELGGDYVFSALPIKNHGEIDLTFKKAFENKQSPWKVYLYKIK
ncbi:hypothetical protein CFK37_10705 [Virgibacillus phasianinus]|uniref:YkoS n=1 Tax=Virgibacillus phasianinus TaxID=2017483 RepID=A0A220U3C2_9BACI|nr:DUF6044 family protein [Virgibacillus phasianinus]ASK62587.1 hypothetical protein CFK37_10705 [Virgibacillus phasianinus]